MRAGVPTNLRRHDDVDLERDRSLVERCQQGDPRAFEDLYLRYRDRLYRFCLRKLGSSSEAEDAVQEAFARAWRALPNFSGERRFYPWLSVIAGNLCIDMQRKRSRWTTVDDEDLNQLAPVVSSEQDAMTETSGDHDLLSRALQRLCDRHREVLELREGRNWTYQQIASHAGVEVSTIETLLFRARKSLRREFLALAQSEGALGVLAVPFFVLRRLARRSLVSFKAAAKGIAGALGPGGAAAAPAIGGAVAVVASAAIVGSSFAVALAHRAPATPTPAAARTAAARVSGVSAGVNGLAAATSSGTNGGAASSRTTSARTSTGTASTHTSPLAQLGQKAGGSGGGLGGILGLGGSKSQTGSSIKKDVKKATSGVSSVVHKITKKIKKILQGVTTTIPLPTVPTTIPVVGGGTLP